MSLFSKLRVAIGFAEEVEVEETIQEVEVPEVVEDYTEKRLKELNMSNAMLDEEHSFKRLFSEEEKKEPTKEELDKIENEKRGRYFKNLLDGYTRVQGKRLSYLKGKKVPKFTERFHGDLNNVSRKVQILNGEKQNEENKILNSNLSND